MGHKQVSYINNGIFHKSEEIAEEKQFERNGRFSLKKSILIIKNIYMNKKPYLIRFHKSRIFHVNLMNKKPYLIRFYKSRIFHVNLEHFSLYHHSVFI